MGTKLELPRFRFEVDEGVSLRGRIIDLRLYVAEVAQMLSLVLFLPLHVQNAIGGH